MSRGARDLVRRREPLASELAALGFDAQDAATLDTVPQIKKAGGFADIDGVSESGQKKFAANVEFQWPRWARQGNRRFAAAMSGVAF